MNIGDLNRRIEVLQFFEDRDDYGGVDGEWLPVGRVLVKIEPGSGTEYFAKQQVNAENETKITIRFYAGISVMNRIRYGEKVYEILGIADHRTAHNMTIINCKEMVSDGLQRKAEESKNNNTRR